MWRISKHEIKRADFNSHQSILAKNNDLFSAEVDLDIVDRNTRSRMMSAVKAKGNRSTEIKMIRLLRNHRISGWRRHLLLPGTPDFAWIKHKVALFVDGCFWHGCSCRRLPKTNVDFWRDKIIFNLKRDHKVDRELRKRGWSVIRVKECKIDTNSTVNRIRRILSRNNPA